MRDAGIHLAVAVFQRHILELTLDCIETQSVRKRRVQIVDLIGHIAHGFFSLMMIYGTHKG